MTFRLPVPDRQLSGTGAGFSAHKCSEFRYLTGAAKVVSPTLLARS